MKKQLKSRAMLERTSAEEEKKVPPRMMMGERNGKKNSVGQGLFQNISSEQKTPVGRGLQNKWAALGLAHTSRGPDSALK